MILPTCLCRRTEVQYKQRKQFSSVSVVTKLQPALPGNPLSIQSMGNIFCILDITQTVVGPTQSHTVQLPGNPPQIVRHTSNEAIHQLTFSTKLKHVQSQTSIFATSSQCSLCAQIFEIKQFGNNVTKIKFYNTNSQLCFTEKISFIVALFCYQYCIVRI